MRSLAARPVLLVVAVLTLASCGRDRPARATLSESESRTTSVPLDSIVAAGQSAYWDGRFDEASEIWKAGLERARGEGDRAREAVLLTSLGLAAWRLGDYASAREDGEAALALKTELGLDSLLFRSYNALGLLAWHEGRLTEAVDRFEAASAAARKVEDSESLAKAANNLGLVYTEFGEFDRARASFLKTLDAARSIGNGTIEATASNNLGMLEVRVGNPQAAIPRLREARRLYHSVDDAIYEQNTLGQLGSAYLALGEPSAALAILDTALQRSREAGLRQEEASNLELIAEVYRTAGDHRRALEQYARAQELDEALGLAVERGANLRSQAEVFSSLGDLDRARDLARRALDAHSEVGAEYEALDDLLLLAEVEEKQGGSDSTDHRLAEARRLSSRLSAGSARVDEALTEARIAAGRRDFPRVLRVLREAKADLDLGSYTVRAEAEHLRARAFAGSGIPDSAAVAGGKAIEHLERIRGAYASPQLRTSFLARRGSVYSDHVEVLLGLGRIEEAFEVADRARGRALLEHVLTPRRETGEPRSLRTLAESEGLLRKIGSLADRLQEVESVPPDERGEAEARTAKFLTRELVESRGRYASLLVSAAATDARTTMLSGGTIRTAAVRASLAPDEAIVSYLVTPTRLRLFLVTRMEIRSLEYEIGAKDLASRVRIARELLGSPNRGPGGSPPVLPALYDVLIGPAIRSGGLHGVKRLIVVPHGVLSYLPFSALVNPVSGRYLVEDYEILTLPSASTLAILRDPDLAPPRVATNRESSVFDPFPGRLPASEREARAVARALGKVSRYEGRKATEAALVRSLGRSGIVHVATHGVMNARNPLFSRLEMAPGGSGSVSDDGRLEVHELLDVRIASRLVFLSGCETGTGIAWSTGFERGEDYATLSKAFLYAGAGSVVATLWRIEDEGAAAFAARFYVHLPGASPASALARAQRDLIHDPRYASPYYWAAYGVSGGE